MERYKRYFTEGRKDAPEGHRVQNKKMDNDTYALRKQVMNYIYRASKVVGEKLPRVDVRITEKTTPEVLRSLGLARMRDNIIWIPEDTLFKYNEHLHEVVFHELAHAIFGTDHIDGCPLMSPAISSKPTPEKVVDKLFKKYYEIWKGR